MPSEGVEEGAPSAARDRRPTQAERRARTRAAVLAAARDVFAERGFQDTNLDEVVQRAGVSKGGMYRYFPDKVSLFAAVFQEFEREVEALLTNAVVGVTTVLEALIVANEAYFDWCLDPVVSQIVIKDAPVVLGYQRWHELDDQYNLHVIEAALVAAIELGEVRPVSSPIMTARFLVAATNEASRYIVHSSDPQRARAEAMASFAELVRSLGVEPA